MQPGHYPDGRNRHRASEIAGVDPTFEEYLGGDPLAFVLSHNLHRRHLNESQRGMVAARLATMRSGGDRKSDKIKSPIGEVILDGKSREEAASDLSVSTTSLDRARRVQRECAPEIIASADAPEILAGQSAFRRSAAVNSCGNLSKLVRIERAMVNDSETLSIVPRPAWEHATREVLP